MDLLMDAGFQLKVLMFFVWIIFMVGIFQKLPQALASKYWTKINGRVVSTKAKGQPIGNGVILYFPVVSYSYTIDGKDYRSDRFTYLGSTGAGFLWRVQSRLRTYAVGSVVEVFVDPRRPDQSVLVPGVHWSQYAGAAVISFFCLGVAFIDQILNSIWPGCQPNCH